MDRLPVNKTHSVFWLYLGYAGAVYVAGVAFLLAPYGLLNYRSVRWLAFGAAPIAVVLAGMCLEDVISSRLSQMLHRRLSQKRWPRHTLLRNGFLAGAVAMAAGALLLLMTMLVQWAVHPAPAGVAYLAWQILKTGAFVAPGVALPTGVLWHWSRAESHPKGTRD